MKSITKKIKEHITLFKPDLIILNNVYISAFSVIEAVKGFRTLRVIHDCRCICHIGICMNENMKKCRGYLFGDCYRCGQKGLRHFSFLHVAAKLNIQARLNSKYNCNRIRAIFPSAWLRVYCEPYGINGTTINNYIETLDTTIHISDNRTKYVYIGGLSVYKGTEILLKSFSKFVERYNAELYVAGPLDGYTKKLFDNYADKPWLHYIGQLSHDKIYDFLYDKYCLIMPSIIMDNYPTAVIEGMHCGKLIIGANRGGIPEMIQTDGLIFDPEKEEDLTDKLIFSQEIDQNDMITMVMKGYERMKGINAESYYSQFIEYSNASI